MSCDSRILPAYDILLQLGSHLGIRSLRRKDRRDWAVADKSPFVHLCRLILLPVPCISIFIHGELRVIVSFRLEVIFAGNGG